MYVSQSWEPRVPLKMACKGGAVNGKIMTNSNMTHKQVQKYCGLDGSSEMILKNAMTEFGLSARAHDKILKVARTIADLADSEEIKSEHIAEAVSYRKLDRKF